MRTHRAAMWSAAVVLVVVSSWGRAQAPEAIRAGADAAWQGLKVSGHRLAPRADVMAQQEQPAPPADGAPRHLFEEPGLSPVVPDFVGPLLGSFVMAQRLDIHRTLLNRTLGALAWDLSMASDSEFKVQYMAFSRPQTFLLKRIEDLNRLRGEGVVVQIDAQTTYKVKVTINIFSPVRGSTLHLEPVNGTRGTYHKIKTGEVLDAVKAHSYVFNADGKEFWLLYGTDVDPKTDQLADTRSLVFVHEAGLDSKAYPVAESKLTVDRPLGVDLGGTTVNLVRAADGTLRIHGR